MAPEILEGYEEPRPVTLIGPMVQPVSTCGLERVFTSDSDLVARFFRRVTHPWEFPDRNPMPTFDLFPRLTCAANDLAEAQRRARFAWSALRHGTAPCTCDDGDDW